MAPRSIAGRLLLASALTTLLAMALVLALMDQVMTRFVTGQIDQRLDNKIVALASELHARPDGSLWLSGEADGPPFDRPEHRSFWIVEGSRNSLRSRWLDERSTVLPARSAAALASPDPVPPGPAPAGLAAHPRTLNTRGLGTNLHLRVGTVLAGSADATILVAAPAEAIRGPVMEAMARVGLSVLALGIVLAVLALVQVRLGLAPLTALRAAVREVSEGRRDRLPEEQPLEVAPLVTELNQLLATNAAHLERARNHVANLAHGLKTPLSTLSLGLNRMDGPGTDVLRRLLDDIDARIRHHLSRARAAALAGPVHARTRVMHRLADLGEALTRIHADRGVKLTIEDAPDVTIACDGHDVDEIFGNLLDNAFKFARAHVGCAVREEGRFVRVTVADDGPGLTQDDALRALQPGQRLDETKPGFGLGLSIARELVELNGGTIELATAAAGLSVEVRLPAIGGIVHREPSLP